MTRCPLPEIVFDGVIDVSHHNGVVDWPAVAGAGIALAFVKATQGARFVDPTFDRNRTGAAAAGVLTVPYHFVDAADPELQARHFITVAGMRQGEPAMIDWETPAPIAAVTTLGSVLVECIGRAPVTYYGYAQLPLCDPKLSEWPLLLPAYPRGNRYGDYQSLVTRGPRLPPGRAADWTNGQRPYDFHQYTPAGRIAGIHGPVDRSIWAGTPAELAAWHATGAVPG
jgi:lysozyme